MQLVVGRIGKPHGIHGELSIEVRTDDPERRFAPGTSIDTDPSDRGPLSIVRMRPHAGRLLMSFEGVDDRSAAEALRGTLLVADSSTSPAIDDDDEFWDHDLVGLAVQTTTGESIGTISEVLHVPGHDMFVVDRDGDELLIPFVKEIVPTVDVAGGRVIVDPPPGLLSDDDIE